MKIAFISAAKSIHIIRWANAMVERGHDVTVISCSNDFVGSTGGGLYNDAVRFVKLKYAAPLGYYLNARSLKKTIKANNYDVINVHYASGYGTLARRAGLKRALLNIWGSDVYDFPYRSGVKKRLLKKNLSYFDFVASTSNCMAKQAATFVDREYLITPFGVDTKLFRPIPGCKPTDKIVFGTVKTLLPKYGIDITIKAFGKLIAGLKKEDRNDIADKLYYEIYGEGEQRAELEKLIAENGFFDKVKLCGYVPNNELPEIYNRFTVFNADSVCNESFGVAAVEAMACGIPVRTSDADGFKEVVEDGVTGIIAPKRDIDTIARNMYDLLMNEGLRETMGRAGVDRVKRYYNWDDNVSLMEGIYERIMRGGQS